MKLLTDERLKHRLVGLAVIISLAAIFAPAIMKKSSQRFSETTSMSIKLPPKPVLAKVTIPEEKSMFETVKVKQIEIPAINEEPQPLSTIAKAEPLSTINVRHAVPAPEQTAAAKIKSVKPKSLLIKAPSMGSSRLVKLPARKPTVLTKNVPMLKKQVAVHKPVLTTKVIKSGYAVQLATFSQQKNALALLAKLKTKGYQGRFNTIAGKNGTLYKVVVGNVEEKTQAQKLQQQLVSSMQMQGFIVTSEVG